MLAGITEIRLDEEVRIVFDLIIGWMFNGAAVVAIVCLMALTIYATVTLIKMIEEELKK